MIMEIMINNVVLAKTSSWVRCAVIFLFLFVLSIAIKSSSSGGGGGGG
jgi:hypothetical protein